MVQSCIGFALLKFIDYLKNNPGNSSENDNSIEEHPTKYIFIYKGIQSIFKKNFTLDINLKREIDHVVKYDIEFPTDLIKKLCDMEGIER